MILLFEEGRISDVSDQCLFDICVAVQGLLSPGVYPQILADQLTLYPPGGADYAHQMILAPPDFQTFRRPYLGNATEFDKISQLI